MRRVASCAATLRRTFQRAGLAAFPRRQNEHTLEALLTRQRIRPSIVVSDTLNANAASARTSRKKAKKQRAGKTNASPVRGQYQNDSAMEVFARLKATQETSAQVRSPRDVATCIVEHVELGECIESLDVAGPGFINIHLAPHWVWGRTALLAAQRGDAVGRHVPALEVPGGAVRVAVDYSSPNVAKEMHVGHLRSTIIGDALARMLEFVGHDVVRVNHVGDWGTQFGMLIAFMHETGQQSVGLADLQRLYQRAKARFDEDADFRDRARAMVVKLQSGESPEVTALWHEICAASREGFQRIYDRLGIEGQEEVGESFYNPMLAGVAEDLEARGVAVLEDDGRLCLHLPDHKFPLIIRKSDGGYTYDTTDMAAIRYRTQELGCDWLLYVTDKGQEEHFHMIIEAARRAGYSSARADHVGFGLVRGEDGKKFRSRAGDTVKLETLLDEALSRASTVLHEHTDSGLSPEERDAAAVRLAQGTVKYADLSKSRQADYVFSFGDMLQWRGNTFLYASYTYARILAVLERSGMPHMSEDEAAELLASRDAQGEPAEWALALQCVQFHDALETSLERLEPHHLCQFVFALCERANSFYAECRVLGVPEEAQRVALLHSAANVLRQSFALLGLPEVSKL